MIKAFTKVALMGMLVVAAIQSCKTERDPCLEPKVVNLRAGVYRRADTGTAIIDSPLTSPVLTAIDAPMVPNSFIYVTRTSKLSLTLDERYDSTRWEIRPDSSAASPRDTLTFFYQHQLRFLSNACGYTYFYSLDSLHNSHHAIDSTKISNPAVTSTATSGEHVKIYYHH